MPQEIEIINKTKGRTETIYQIIMTSERARNWSAKEIIDYLDPGNFGGKVTRPALGSKGATVVVYTD